MTGYADGVFTLPDGAENAVPKDIIQSSDWNSTYTSISDGLTQVGGAGIEVVARDGYGVFLPGVKGYLECPADLIINGWKILGDQTGSIVIDIWKVPFASFPPSVTDSITGLTPPTISSSQSASSTTLTGWATSISKADILAFNVVSCSSITQFTLSLSCGRN